MPSRLTERMSAVVVRMVIVAASLVAAALYLGATSRAEELPPREPLAGLAMVIDGWQGRRQPDLEPEVLAVLGADDYLLRTYSRAGVPGVGVYVGYHSSQRQGDTIHSPLNCLPGGGWQPVDVGRLAIPVQGAPDASGTIVVNRVTITKGLDRQLVLYWYQSHRRVVASEYWGKIYTVLDSVRYNRTDAALVRVVTPLRDGEPVEAVERRAVWFVQSLFPLLPRYLPS